MAEERKKAQKRDRRGRDGVRQRGEGEKEKGN